MASFRVGGVDFLLQTQVGQLQGLAVGFRARVGEGGESKRLERWLRGHPGAIRAVFWGARELLLALSEQLMSFFLWFRVCLGKCSTVPCSEQGIGGKGMVLIIAYIFVISLSWNVLSSHPDLSLGLGLQKPCCTLLLCWLLPVGPVGTSIREGTTRDENYLVWASHVIDEETEQRSGWG